MTNNTTNQEKRCLKHWVLKFLIIVATILVLAFAVCLGFHHRAKVITKTVTDTLEMIDDEISDHVDNLMEDATSNPTDGVTNINTSIR